MRKLRSISGKVGREGEGEERNNIPSFRGVEREFESRGRFV